MLKFAVIGVGRMGSTHAANLFKSRVKGAGLVAVCDIAESSIGAFFALKELQNAGREVKSFKCVDDLVAWGGFDVALIATPHYSHIDIAEQVLGIKKHVIIEKPMAVTAGEARGFLDRHGKNFELSKADNTLPRAAVVYNQRSNPVYAKAKKLLEQNALGEIRRVDMVVTDWYRSDAYYKENDWRGSYSGEGGGLLINQCIHQLDLLTWLVGLPKSVFAKCQSRGRLITAENEVSALLTYDNGALGTLSASGRELFGTNNIEIVGDKGKLVLGIYSAKHIEYFEDEVTVNANVKNGYGGTTKKVKRYTYGKNLLQDKKYGQQLRVLQNFTDHILKGEPLLAPAADGIDGIKLFNAIYLSSWQNQEVQIPFDEKLYDDKLSELARLEYIK